MEIVGYIASIIMGLLLGLIGGGGSILTIPILVYLFGVDPVLATAYSLFVVGVTSLVGSVSHFRHGNVHLKTAILFGIPSVVAVFIVRKFIVPIIPDPIFSIGGFEVSKPLFIMVLFAILMMVAAFSMIIKPKKETTDNKTSKHNYFIILLEGLLVGGVTGLVGAGGGFLIIPALVLFVGLSMRRAVGTSLLIIALKSLIGFTGDMTSAVELDYSFLILFSSFAIVGILTGTYIHKFIPSKKLKPAFGWFVLAMGIFILSKELLFGK
jgi:uncharacterized protein